MNGGGAVELFLQGMLDIVDLIVYFQQISLCGNLCVKGNDASAGTIVMNDEIVNTVNYGRGIHHIFNFMYQLRIRLLSKKRIQRIFHSGNACVENEESDKKTKPAIQKESGILADHCGCKYQSGGDRVA